MKKILIIGASGFIGSHIYDFFRINTNFKIIGTRYKKKKENLFYLDYHKKNSFLKKLNSINPDIIIWSAGEKKLSVTESKNFNYNLNVEPIKTILYFIEYLSVKKPYFVFISSDYVFSGDKGNYSSLDIPDPKNKYGLSKLNSEKLIIQTDSNYCILRVGGVIGKGGTFFDWILNEIENSQDLKLYNEYFSPTPIETLCEAIQICIQKKLKGIFHVSGNERISKFQFGVQLKKKIKNSISKLIEINSNTYTIKDRSLKMSEEFIGIMDLQTFFNSITR